MNINPNNIKTLAVFGCGGTGSHVAAGLARLEKAINELGGKFPKVTICDPDVVEQPNVGRQLFSDRKSVV
jgi:molybdopterin/thiamine biosynthesis adenylyltransferase